MSDPGMRAAQQASDAARRAAEAGMRSSQSFQRSQSRRSTASPVGTFIGIVLMLVFLAAIAGFFLLVFQRASGKF